MSVCLEKTDFLVDVCVHEQLESSVGVCSLVKRFEVEVYDVVGNEVDEDNKIVVVMKRLWFYWPFLIGVPLLPDGDGEVPIEVAHLGVVGVSRAFVAFSLFTVGTFHEVRYGYFVRKSVDYMSVSHLLDCSRIEMCEQVMPEVYVMTVWLITFIHLENKVHHEVVKVVFGVEITTKDRFGILECFDVLLVLDASKVRDLFAYVL